MSGAASRGRLGVTLAVVALACGVQPLDVTGGAGASSGGAGWGGQGGASGGGGVGAGVPPPPTQTAACQAQIYACGDLVDNDGDGLVDYQDPDCLGPCDNTESSFYGGIPGQAGPPCLVDCYFDQDSGSGNDGCFWNHRCDPLEVPPSYFPESEAGAACEHDPAANTPGTTHTCAELSAAQDAACLAYCLPLVPNGCDCFGCCELPAGSGAFVWLGSEDENGNGTCAFDGLADPARCQPCTPVPGCWNPCDACELCVGKPSLPPGCGAGGAGGGPSPSCPDGVLPCGVEGIDPCPSNFYCTTGCCQPIPT